MPTSLDWRWRRFAELTVSELDAIYRARQEAFVIEQQCLYLDADGCDPLSFHLAAWSMADPLPAAYARVLQPGLKYREPSIGRVLTLGAARGTGLGRELVRRAVAHCHQAFPRWAIRISAQSHLERFYAEFGFTVVGERYSEDGISHTEMLLGR
jgi:ElaA protein